jgi:hypothetical protein
MKTMKVVKCLLFVGLSGIMGGCKLAVIVVEGGEVQSIGSGTCAAGTICIVEVSEPGFAEIFTAIPDDGWYLQKWNSGDSFFCGGSTDPTCTLSFQGHEESKAVEDMVASSETFYLMPVFRQFSDILKVDGKEWYQPYLFLNLPWNDIRAVCPPPEGICAGTLNGYDMTGWTWASLDDVTALFNHYIGSDEFGPGEDFYGIESDLVVDAIFSDGWRFSEFEQVDEPGLTLGGMVHYLEGASSAAYTVAASFDVNGPGIVGDILVALRLDGGGIDDSGAWFYHTP